MTKSTELSVFDPFSFFRDFGVGFEREMGLFQDLSNSYKTFVKNSFPHYNIKKESENKYVIELAVAGFGKQDLEIDLSGNTLTVSGNIQSETNEDQYFVKGIAERGFTRQFKVADSVKVNNASLTNGILKIWLEQLATTSKTKVEIED